MIRDNSPGAGALASVRNRRMPLQQRVRTEPQGSKGKCDPGHALVQYYIEVGKIRSAHAIYNGGGSSWHPTILILVAATALERFLRKTHCAFCNPDPSFVDSSLKVPTTERTLHTLFCFANSRFEHPTAFQRENQGSLEQRALSEIRRFFRVDVLKERRVKSKTLR
jgi:hypothetical protein